MFNVADYSRSLKNRTAQLNERFAELQSNMQLIQQEMRFIEIEIAGLDGQSTLIRIMNDSKPLEDNINKDQV